MPISACTSRICVLNHCHHPSSWYRALCATAVCACVCVCNVVQTHGWHASTLPHTAAHTYMFMSGIQFKCPRINVCKRVLKEQMNAPNDTTHTALQTTKTKFGFVVNRVVIIVLTCNSSVSPPSIFSNTITFLPSSNFVENYVVVRRAIP